MKHIWRIIKFTGSLWRYYVAISVLTILLALMSQLQPILTKAVIDQVTKIVGGGHANVRLVAIYAVIIFMTDIGQTLFGNIGGYMGDIVTIKIKQILSNRYYEHILSLPQAYFDT